MAMDFDTVDIHAALKQIFGFSQFKGTQEEVIRSLMNGHDTFVIMPTGGGKSMCYQLPALLMPGTAIIISPLISLMKNQVDAVRNFGTDMGVAHYLNSSLHRTEILQVKDQIMSGHTKLLYVAPESLTKRENIDFFKKVNISFYAIDEAHCISEWGHDFRQEYRRLRPLITEIGKQVPVIALTATATPKVQRDIQRNLNMQNANVFISSFNRPNLYYEVRRKNAHIDRDIVRYIRENAGKSGIIYCLSRKRVDELSRVLQANCIRALPYHAGLEPSVRASNQDQFLHEDVEVIVATIAFGMGIDKPDVRYVIHYNMPKSLEGYYQETGRAGRDGGEGHCIAFYSEDDISKLENFIKKEKDIGEQEVAMQLISETTSYAETGMCRRKNLLHYFGEDYPENHCDNCDNCLHPKERVEVREEMLTVLNAMQEVDAPIKVKHLIHLLIGQVSAPLKSMEQHKLPCFGSGESQASPFWASVIRQALIENLLVKDIDNYGNIVLSPKGIAYIDHPYSILVAKDYDYDADDAALSVDLHAKSEAVDQILLGLLKDELKATAKRLNVNTWAILTEPSLIDMTIQYPITLEEMSQISGMGMVKAKKFGQFFLDIICRYVEENEIERPQDLVVKSIINKSGLKVYIIQSIDRKLPLEDIAKAKGLSMDDLIGEMERIVASGTKINIGYYIQEFVDPYHVEEILDYFQDAENDNAEEAWTCLGENEYNLEEIRLVRLKYMTEVGF